MLCSQEPQLWGRIAQIGDLSDVTLPSLSFLSRKMELKPRPCLYSEEGEVRQEGFKDLKARREELEAET